MQGRREGKTSLDSSLGAFVSFNKSLIIRQKIKKIIAKFLGIQVVFPIFLFFILF